MKNELRRLFMVTLGALIYAAGITMFIVPLGLYTGGLTGYAVLMVNLLAREDIIVNLGLAIFLVNLPAYIFGYFKISRKFVVYSLLALTIQSIFVAWNPYPIVELSDPMHAAIFGGLLLGTGFALVLRQGAAIAGMSVIAYYINVRFQSTIGNINLFVNAGVIALVGLFFSLLTAFYTLIVLVTVSVVVDRLYTAYRRVKLEIITEKGDEIKAMLFQKFRHGMTTFEGKGGYTGNRKDVIVMIAFAHEAYYIKQAITSIDPVAYITREDVYMMNGLFKYVQLP
jgi:uncharacterized membrane-anchored protein YitT (DUF2179 family)